MKYVVVSYVSNPQFSEPEAWFKRINAYSGILEALATTDQVISIEQINYEGELLKNGIQYVFKKLTDRERLFPQKLHSFIKTIKPDVVLVHGAHFPLQVLQLRLMLGKRVKIIVQHHAEKPFNRIKKYIQLLADRYIDAYLFAAHNMGIDWVKRGNLASPKKINELMEVSSVFSPVNRACAQSKTGVTQQKSVFLWVARLIANKNPLTVVAAFLEFASQHNSAVLYMIYQDYDLLDDVQRLINNHPYGKNVVMVGAIPHHQLLYWFNSADFILSGSYYEGTCAAVCEAMSCGCIPIVTAIDSFKMITDNGKYGFLYEPGNSDALLAILSKTTKMDIAEKRAITLNYYNTTLSFDAIAKQLRKVVACLFINN